MSNFRNVRIWELVLLPRQPLHYAPIVKLRFEFVDIWWFCHHSDFAWNQILANSNSPKMSFLAIWEVLNFDFSKFEQLSSPKFTKIQSSESKIAKNDIFGPFWFTKIWFHIIWSGGKMINFQQSQALTSHFESFWSIVVWEV